MGWDEIDFDKIVTGAVTVDPNSEMNYYEVLNLFSTALDERLNVIIQSGRELPTLPEIEFEPTGEIRAGNTFFNKYKSLLDGYYNLWDDYTWYHTGAMDDPLNFDLFEVTEADLELAMGANAYDLLVNRGDKDRRQLWSAELLVGLYELYKLLNIQERGLGNRRDHDNTVYNKPMYFSSDDDNLQWGGPTGYDPPRGEFGESGSYGGAKGAFFSTLEFVTYIGANNRPPWITFTNQSSNGSGGDFARWNVSGGGRDYMVVSMKSESLTGSAVTFDLAGTGAQVRQNYIEERIGNDITKKSYDDNFPYVDAASLFPDSPESQSIEYNYQSTSIDSNLGAQYIYYEYGNISNETPAPFIDPEGAPTEEDNLALTSRFDLRMHGSFLVNFNSQDLEFNTI
tara:strand:+ start:2185 stop:3375 length:1191 start_codon:yes stop_codon:yes gene_type:complete